MTRRALAATALAIVLVAGTGRAGAHVVDPSVLTVIDEVVPDADGLHVEVATSVTTQLVVANDTAEVLEVLDEGGQPFLRIGPDGVEANLAAPAWYLTNQPFGGNIPPGAGSEEPPRWARVSAERTWGWFDHRLHPTDIGGVLGEDDRPTFEVPMRLGDRDITVRGHLEQRTTVQRFSAALRAVPEPSTGLVVQLLDGRAPGLFARYTGTGQAVVVGADGEPFLRLGPDGAEVNRRSPTWLYSAQARGEDLTGVTADPTAAPEWAVVATSPSYAWLDPRALIEQADDEVVTLEWVVPVDVDGTRVEVAGTSRAEQVPIAALVEDDDEGADVGLLVAVVAATSVTLAAVVWLARSRARRAR